MIRFSDIFSQDAAIGFLHRALLRDRLPHAMVFSGPVGVGKEMTARALAGLWLCHDRPAIREDQLPVACDKCDSCRVMSAGNHPDYHLVYRQLVRIQHEDRKAIDLSIDVIRPYLVEPANRKAMLNHGKVFVVEQAELMSVAAQNALLKTLEEPSAGTLIILLTDQPNQLLQTIRSRSQMVRFGRLPSEKVRQFLMERGLSASDANDAADFADGSLGLALRWSEDGVIQHARRLSTIVHQILVRRGDTSELQGAFTSAADEYAEKQLKRDPLGSKPQATREGLNIHLHLAASALSGALRRTDDEALLDSLCGGIEAIVETERNLDANVNVSLAFQQLGVALERVSLPASHG